MAKVEQKLKFKRISGQADEWIKINSELLRCFFQCGFWFNFTAQE
jgi:hypothetical protein